MSKKQHVADTVARLGDLDIAGLRETWQHYYGPPPSFRSTDLLSRLLAWRLQADALGGLDTTTIRLLASERAALPPVELAPGTRLAREWNGERHEVDVTEAGFRYQGTTYRSLSHVARTITGTRWNGLRFFGLREENRA